ncbi:MAG TPA: FxsA family protein [Solirubrobacteraceae bacterium]|jgi:UPF0716 protein FxsA|nr:FxsA family protein [Solirubrobacteraceae bacterium]
MFFLLFIVWVVAEIFVIVKVAEAIGVLLTIVLLIAAWPVGTWAMRSEGRVVLRHFSAAVAEGRPPGREVVDGVLVALGGVLLMVPGFISDAFGLFLLFPPTRALVRVGLVRNFQHRLVARAGRAACWPAGGRPGPGRPGGVNPADVEGTATEVDPPHLRP